MNMGDFSCALIVEEHEVFTEIHRSLVEGMTPDRYYVLYDLGYVVEKIWQS